MCPSSLLLCPFELICNTTTLHYSLIAVIVKCKEEFIDVGVQFDNDDQYFGIVHTRPNRGCSLIGNGDNNVHLMLPLHWEKREQCGLVQHEQTFMAIVDVRKHFEVELITDNTFLIQCPLVTIENDIKTNHAIKNLITDQTIQTYQSEKNSTFALGLFDLIDQQPVHMAIIDMTYTIEIIVPNNKHYEVSSCVAFSAIDDLNVIQLSDENGCVTDDLSGAFMPIADNRLQTTIKMFNFNQSNFLHIQCQIVECNGQCKMKNCTHRTETFTGLLSQNSIDNAANMIAVSMRINIQESQTLTQIDGQVDESVCDVSPNRKSLIILLITLIILNIMTYISAWHNRPFRIEFKIADPNMPYSIKQNLFQVIDEPITPLSAHRLFISTDQWKNTIKSAFSTLSSIHKRQRILIAPIVIDDSIVNIENGNNNEQTIITDCAVDVDNTVIECGKDDQDVDNQTASSNKQKPTPPLRIEHQNVLTENEEMNNNIESVNLHKQRPLSISLTDLDSLPAPPSYFLNNDEQSELLQRFNSFYLNENDNEMKQTNIDKDDDVHYEKPIRINKDEQMVLIDSLHLEKTRDKLTKNNDDDVEYDTNSPMTRTLSRRAPTLNTLKRSQRLKKRAKKHEMITTSKLNSFHADQQHYRSAPSIIVNHQQSSAYSEATGTLDNRDIYHHHGISDNYDDSMERARSITSITTIMNRNRDEHDEDGYGGGQSIKQLVSAMKSDARANRYWFYDV